MGSENSSPKQDLEVVTMAPVEVETIPYDIMAPAKNLKVVDKAFELPLVTSAYTEITSLASPLAPYVENTVTTITPMVEAGYTVIKTKVEGMVMPHLPVAVEKADSLACGGVDQLVEKVPALKEATPELVKNTKATLATYFTSATSFLASFSLAQVALKVVDTGLEVVEQVIAMTGGSEENIIASGIKTIHTTANTIRIEGNKKAGTEKAKRIEEASIVGALVEVSGLSCLLNMLGLKVTETATVYEDEHARVEVETEDDAEPVVVDTN